jgi:hypothetical protein
LLVLLDRLLESESMHTFMDNIISFLIVRRSKS